MNQIKMLIFTCLGVLFFLNGCKSKNVNSSGLLKIDGVELPYITEGTGLPCLIYGIRQYHSKTFSSNFKSRFRCTIVDSRFVVPSAIADSLSPFTVEAAVKEIEAIRMALNMPKFVLVGHSILGIITLEYAKRYPDNVLSLIEIGTLPELSKDQTKLSEDYWEKNASVKRKELHVSNWMKLTQDSLKKMLPSNAFIASVVADAPQRWYDSVYNESQLLSGVQYNMPILNQLASQDFYIFNDSTKIKPPVFLAMGKYDFGCPYTAWERYLPMFNDITFQLFNHSGHVPQTEEAAKFDSLVFSWIDKKK
jgi:proline iminopeptidase